MKTRYVKSKIATTIICAIVIALFCLVVIDKYVFQGAEYSILNKDEWAVFLGSFIGGIVGTIGLLVAVLLTTRETRDIQRENEEKILEDRKQARRKERKAFGDEIAASVARYITDVRTYFLDNKISKEIDAEIEKYKEEREEIRQNIDVEYGGIDEMYTDFNIERYLRRVEYFTCKIEEKEREKERYIANKKIAMECYFFLQIKLAHIESARELLEKLGDIHEQIEQMTEYDGEWIDTEITVLKELTIAFIEKYVRGN